MNYKKVLVIILAVLFFLAALTSYINRVLFPRLIKKIAIERIEDIVKRKVEIGRLHFSWVKGFVIDKIKIYEKDSNKIVMAQAEQVSFGIIIFPGFKHYRITIPFINVRSPSVHLVRISDDSWNFSDIFASPPNRGKDLKHHTFEIAWGGITINDGRCLVNDLSHGRQWSEFFDNINLRLSLSYKGISYDFTADIPGKKGSLGARVYYQPLTQNTLAQIHLKNIDTASYLSLIDIPDMHLDSGIIEEINLNINHNSQNTSAQGNVIMKKLDITSQDENFKGDIEINGLDAQYQNGNISARGQIDLSNIQTRVTGLSASGSIQARVNNFELSPEGTTNFSGSLDAQHVFVRLKDRQVLVDGVSFENISIQKDENGFQSSGSVYTRGLNVQWPHQQLQGDISVKNVTMRMKDENDIHVQGDLQADNFYTTIDDNVLNSRHIRFEGAALNILNQKNITLQTKLSIDNISIINGTNTLSSTSLNIERLSLKLDDDVINLASTINASDAKVVLNNSKIIAADPRLEINLQMPLSDPEKLIYKGSVTFSNGHLQGFYGLHSLDNVELDADFDNDEATINALSINILDTNVHITGSVKNFKDPYLKIIADADDLNLSKMDTVLPHFVNQYGLIFNGTSFVKVQFEGQASDPWAAKILAVASVKNASITSEKFHQRIKNITGILEATPNSLKWRDTTATYQGQHYYFAGSLENFKNPRIFTRLIGPNLEIQADLHKNDNIISINSLSGKYFDVNLNSTGIITLRENKNPLFAINTNASALLEDLVNEMPLQQKEILLPLNPMGILSMNADLKGTLFDWKNNKLNATLTSPIVRIKGYKITEVKIDCDRDHGKNLNLTFDGKFYTGTMHGVGALDLSAKGIPYKMALNIDATDLHQFKLDSPLKMQEIDGKFYFTTIAHGTLANFKNDLQATGSMSVRDGFLGEFNIFKGLLSILNNALNLGEVMITDAQTNFTINDEKISTDNLRLKGPTIVLLGKGWVNFDEICDLNVTVDLSSGVVPAIAHDMLKSLTIHIYDKITDPKFKKKISVPQVINTLFKNLWQ